MRAKFTQVHRKNMHISTHNAVNINHDYYYRGKHNLMCSSLRFESLIIGERVSRWRVISLPIWMIN